MLGCSTVYIALVTTNTERNQQSKFMCNTRFPDSSRISAALGSEQVTNTNLAPGLVDRCQWPLQSSWRVSVSIGVNIASSSDFHFPCMQLTYQYH